MPLYLRRRGNIWHVRGTVRVGRQTIAIRDFSTGSSSRAAAETLAAEEEARVRGDALDGPGGRARRLTVAECIIAYAGRPGGIPRNDRDRCDEVNDLIGDRLLTGADGAWAELLRTRGKDWAPATAARWRATLQAALNAGAKAHGGQAPRLAAVQEPTQEVSTWLTISEQDRLLAAYSRNAAPVALALCFAGLRSQEALRLDWRHVSWRRNELFIPGATTEGGKVRRRSKSGQGRAVPMHPRLRTAIAAIWVKRGEPDSGPVFLSVRGKPYSDSRDVGGNPLTKAHITACLKAGLSRPSGRATAVGEPILRHTFRVHDWRHHWASWMVMTGTDLHTLMKLGGWSSARMVQRYASVSSDHMAKAIARLA